MNYFLLKVHDSSTDEVLREYNHEQAGSDGANWADNVMADRGCPDEYGLLYNYGPDGDWHYDVTIEGDPAGLRRCTRHAH